MKEIRFFYAPDVAADAELPADEAAHCLRVLRLQAGDEIHLTDGKGMFYKAEITTATGKRCLFKVLEAVSHPKEWSGHLHLALAPTKNMDRIEWLAEKATEIGFDELTFLDCRYSERKVVKTERIDKILVSAMKQSHKARKPLLNEMEDFKRFVARPFAGQKFIAHCYDEADVAGVAKASEDKAMDGGKPFLLDELDAGHFGAGGTGRGFQHRRGAVGAGSRFPFRKFGPEPPAYGDGGVGGGSSDAHPPCPHVKACKINTILR